MNIVIALGKTYQNRVHAENFLKIGHDRNRAAFFHEYRFFPETGLDGQCGSIQPGAVGWHDYGTGAAVLDNLNLDRLGRYLAKEPLGLVADILRILIRDKTHGDFARSY